jgi:hypothetical protein
MGTTREQILQQHAAGRVFQERYDSALEPWGVRARAPTLGEDIANYRRDELVRIKKLLPNDHELRKVQIRQLRDDALDVFEPQILKAARDTSRRADTVPVDAPLRRVEHTDGNGMKVVDFIGQRSFIHDFNRQGRRVVSFRTDQGYVNASGFALR